MNNFEFSFPDGHLSAMVSIEGFYNVTFILNELGSERVKNEYWNKVKVNFKENGFRSDKQPRDIIESKYAGENGFYHEAFMNYANNKIMELSPVNIIMSDEYEYQILEDKSCKISFKMWEEPKVISKDESINLEDYFSGLELKLPKADINQIVDIRLNSFAKLNPNLHNKVDENMNQLKSEPYDMVEVTIEAFVDGERLVEACITTNMRLISGHIVIPELYDKLIGVLPGDKFSIDTTNFGNFYNPNKPGKILHLDVVVNNVYRCTETSVDDDLAISAGFNSLDDWERKLIDITQRKVNGYELTSKRNFVLKSVKQIFDIDELPQVWIEGKLIEAIKEGSIKQLSKDTVEQMKEMRKQLSLLKVVGAKLGIEYDDSDKSICHRYESDYVAKVIDNLVGRIKYIYVDKESDNDIRGNREDARSQV